MPVLATDGSVTQVEADAVVIGAYASGAWDGPAAEVDEATGGALTRLRTAKEITGKPLELVSILAPAGLKATQVLVVGLGERDGLQRGTAYRAAAAAAKQLAAKERRRVAFFLGEGWTAELLESAVCGSLVGCHGQDLYRAEKNRHPFAELRWSGVPDLALESGRILGTSVNLARKLVNEPPSHMYPEAFAAAAKQVAEEANLELEVWDRDRLEAERCQSLLAVARGSQRPPRLVQLTYRAGGPQQPLLALVGKGVTFDSGGLSLKPTDSMKTMKCDMAGAAAVLAAMRAIALLKLPVNVIGLCGLVENMISGDAYKVGDVLKARNGRTIEVLNTDAEGRLVLADVLDVAVQHGAAKIVDLATLTGACVVALGTDVAGAMSNDQAWCDSVLQAARVCGEPLWQLPMFKEYADNIRSEVADIKNTGDGRWGGAMAGGKFLEEFVAGKPWTHLDIAGPAFLDGPKPWQDAGGTGCFVRTLIELVRHWPGK